MKFYFEYPRRSGTLYALPVEAAVDAADVARLEDGQLVYLTTLERWPPIVISAQPVDSIPTIEGHQGKAWDAELVFDPEGGTPRFSGDWSEWLEAIEAAAYTNALFGVVLTVEEYKHLERGGIDELKRHLSDNAAARLCLLESYPLAGDDEPPFLLIARYGRCPR